MDPTTLEAQFGSLPPDRHLSEETANMASVPMVASTTALRVTTSSHSMTIPFVNGSTSVAMQDLTTTMSTLRFTPTTTDPGTAIYSTTVPLRGINTTSFAIPHFTTTTTTPRFTATTDEGRTTYVGNATSEETNSTMHGSGNTLEAVLAEVSIRPIPFARWTGIFAPWVVALTWCVCGWDTWKHAKAVWSRTGVVEHHDLVIQIIALPMVYSLMALSAVLRMWKLMSNSFGSPAEDLLGTWEARRDRAFEIYEADYAVADLYESWALHHFAVLALTVLRQNFSSLSQLLQRSAASLDTESPLFQAWAGTLKGMHRSVSNLAMLGVWSFVIACACTSLYVLTAIVAQEALGQDSALSAMLKDNTEKMKFFNYGMGCVASSVAICNMIQIEKTFHFELLYFRPFLKFWGTKILVSIAFLQTIVFNLPVPPFRHMSSLQMNVTYSTLICYECLLISLLHMYAWRADEDWYRDGCRDSETGGANDAADSSSSTISWPSIASVAVGRSRAEEMSSLKDARAD